MGIPARPGYLDDESLSCDVLGHEMRHTYCTSSSYAMHIRRSTLGRLKATGCAIRRLTRDTSGGTTIQQNEAVARDEYGVVAEVRVGSNVCTPIYAASRLRQGRGIVLQGNAGVLIKATGKSLTGATVSLRSTKGYVNHCVYVNEGRGWHDDGHGNLIPTECLVYDPEANGRLAGWGRAASGPQWWPWAVVVAFAAALRPWGDTDTRTLGAGKWYCAIGPDTEPHVHLRYTGSVRTTPFPATLVAAPLVAGRRVNGRSGPSTKYGIVKTYPRGTRIAFYQVNDQGQRLTWREGGVSHTSGRWYGSHDGTIWVHISGLNSA